MNIDDEESGAGFRDLLTRASTAEKVADVLREEIAAGRFLPGERLSEERLSRAFGVSRNTLRESFRLLSRERLVVHRMNRGVFVSMPTRDDIADLFRLRRLLEVPAVAAAQGADLNALVAAVEHGEKSAAEANWSEVTTADLQFHRALTALLGSERVNELFRTVMAELRLVFHLKSASADFHEPYLRRNRALVELLLAASTDAAEQELLSYLSDAEQELLAANVTDLNTVQNTMQQPSPAVPTSPQ